VDLSPLPSVKPRPSTHTLTVTEARRLALARAGLLDRSALGLRRSARRSRRAARNAAFEWVDHFGYLQLDTISVAGARSHGIVLHSRLDGFDTELGETLLQPGGPLFEYWGHEACWMPLEMYPLFGWRRAAFRDRPWWKRAMADPENAKRLLERIRSDGAVRSADLEGAGKGAWWGYKPMKLVAVALWSSGELAITSRNRFQREFDLAERVIPRALLDAQVEPTEAMRSLIIRALQAHGWASTATIAATWRLKVKDARFQRAMEQLREADVIVPCEVAHRDGPLKGWIRPDDIDVAGALGARRFASRKGVLLSPFDPVLWDRARVNQLFDFHQLLEVYKPKAQRQYGYFCLPVLANDRLMARVDLKAHRKRGALEVLSLRHEASRGAEPASRSDGLRVESALERYAESVGLALRTTSVGA